MIKFTNLSKSYNNAPILKNINLNIPSRDFVTLIGPSGAGKSTILKILAGFIKPDHGNIEIDGTNLNQLNTRTLQLYRRKIGFIFQDYKLLEHKTVYQNLAFLLEASDFTPQQIPTMITEALHTVKLEHKFKAYPPALSGGEKQRLAIARAIVHHPKIIIADEPTGNLDPQLSLEIGNLLLDINNLGNTIIQISHDTTLVNFLHKRVIAIKQGQIVSDENPSNYYAVN